VKLLLRAAVVLALLAPALVSAQAPAVSGGDTPHAAAHRQLQVQFQKALEAGPAAALAFATKRFDAAATLGLDDPARADAFELMAQADLAAQRYREALPLATEVVRIRRLARPPEHEQLALALGLNATLLFAADRSEESDAQLRESLDEYRRAFGPHDVRLAQKLEGQAELVQKGFGRTPWVIELLREAAAIREGDAASSRGKLAETLVELSIHEMNASEYGACEAHLARAAAVLEAGLATHRDDEEWKALLVQALVLKSGLAGKLANPGEALRLARQAQAIAFADRATRVEMQLVIIEALGTQLELSGDIDGAIREEKRILETIAGNADLFESHRLDPLVQGDSLLSLAKLYLQKDDLPEARTALVEARQGLGDSEGVLFAFAELERKGGDEAQALAHYRAALKLRKESASEVTVLFGTNREPLPGGEAGRFGGEPSETLRLGSAEVLVPGAQFSTKAWLRPSSEPLLPVGHATNAARLLIRAKRVLDEPAFRARASTLMKAARLDPQAALVFVHGFNVTFDEALQRGAQLARDLNFDGPVFVFSWPSKGSLLRYGADRSSADAAARSLIAFLGQVVAATGAKQVHVLAHSMGNRVLLPSLVKIERDAQSPVRERLGEIILAAPAVPERDFEAWLDDIVAHGGSRLTLYASSVDRAMQVGWYREWGTTLAGYTSRGAPLVHAGLQSIDISKAASGDLLDLNHDVFASNPVMSEDIRQLLQSGSRLAPDRRLPTLVPKYAGAGTGAPAYWSYEPAQRQ
jgi:esterase/lipase superfamily enzyme